MSNGKAETIAWINNYLDRHKERTREVLREVAAFVEAHPERYPRLAKRRRNGKVRLRMGFRNAFCGPLAWMLDEPTEVLADHFEEHFSVYDDRGRLPW